MDTEGPQTEKGRSGVQPKSNVVHFPRDWLGPRDELVPFGVEAAQDGEDDDSVAALRTSPPEPNPPPSPPSASDFWGEHSAEIHDVLQAPSPTDTGPDRDPTLVRPRRPPSPVGRWRRWSHKRDVLSGTAQAITAAARAVGRHRCRWTKSAVTHRAATRVLIGAAGLACLVLVVEAVSWAPSGHVAATGSPASRLGSLLKSADVRLGFGQPLAGVNDRQPAQFRERVRTSRVGRHRTRVALSRLPRARRGAPRAAPSSAAAAPSAPSSTVVQGGSAVVTQSGSGAGKGSGVVSGVGSATGSAASAGGGSGTPSGPVGAGAPFGPGHLG